MEIPLDAQVECTDGIYGRSVYVLLNPVIEKVSHLVVQEDASPNTLSIVPVELVSETIPDRIRLRCSKAEMQEMHPFLVTTVIKDRVPEMELGSTGGMLGMGNYYLPFVTAERTVYEPLANRQTPPGELAVRRGTRVEATDGDVGHVDEFVVNPENGMITDLVLREGHLWGKKDVIIPLSEVDQIREDTVFLKLDKSQIDALPTYPLNRHWS